MSRIVRRAIDLTNPPAPTEAQKAELEALEAKGDSEIDTSEIPELGEKFWRNASRNPYYRPVKQQLTLRLDSDIVAWFKSHAREGKGYQTNINRVLRDYVESQEKEQG